jgi:hypothetical protein
MLVSRYGESQRAKYLMQIPFYGKLDLRGDPRLMLLLLIFQDEARYFKASASGLLHSLSEA